MLLGKDRQSGWFIHCPLCIEGLTSNLSRPKTTSTTSMGRIFLWYKHLYLLMCCGTISYYKHNLPRPSRYSYTSANIARYITRYLKSLATLRQSEQVCRISLAYIEALILGHIFLLCMFLTVQKPVHISNPGVVRIDCKQRPVSHADQWPCLARRIRAAGH